MPKPKKSKTHFEQVPLEIVKNIVGQEVPDANADEATVETPKKKTSRIQLSRVRRG
jgi:hypothetical protein